MKKLVSTAWLIAKLAIGVFVLLFFYLLFSGFGSADRVASPSSSAALQPTAPLKTSLPLCKPSDFTVKIDRVTKDYGADSFKGSVVNNSSTACGVRLKAATFDKADAVLEVSDFWPAGSRNIQPSATEVFSRRIPANKSTATYSFTPIEVLVW